MPNDSKPSTPPIPRNPAQVNIADPAELKYWTAHLGVTANKLKECVLRVGMRVPDVKRSLGK